RFEARVILMHAVKPATAVPMLTVPDMESPAATEMAVEAARRQDKINITHAKRYLQRKLRGITSQGINGSYHVIMGDTAESIMELCKKEHITLVVVMTHGKGGIKRAIMGSVADKVIRHSEVPVLVIRPKTVRRNK
ncbi:universal stress protein, partial [Chloroflexota bacterium]